MWAVVDDRWCWVGAREEVTLRSQLVRPARWLGWALILLFDWLSKNPWPVIIIGNFLSLPATSSYLGVPLGTMQVTSGFYNQEESQKLNFQQEKEVFELELSETQILH